MSEATIDRVAVGQRAPARTISRRRLMISAAAIALLAGIGTYGYRYATVGRYIESTDDAYVGGNVTTLAPKVAGFVAEVAVSDNQTVKQGDLLIRLDDRDYRAAFAKSDAAVAAQHAALDNLDASRTLQLSLIAEAESDIQSTAADVIWTHADRDRYRTTSLSGASPVRLSQQADAASEKAQAADRRARAAVVSAQRRLAVIDTQKEQVRTALAQAEAERDLAKLALSYTEIRAPIDGVVGNRSAHVGAYAPIGSQLLTLIPAHGLWVDANFKESQLAGMRPGQPVRIFADAVPGRIFTGHLVSLAPATGAQFSVLPAENATGNFTKIVQRVSVRLLLDGDGAELGSLRPGLSVTAEVDERGASR